MLKKAVGATGLEIREAPIGLAFPFKSLPGHLEGGESVDVINILRNLQGGAENSKIEGQSRLQNGGRPELHPRRARTSPWVL